MVKCELVTCLLSYQEVDQMECLVLELAHKLLVKLDDAADP